MIAAILRALACGSFLAVVPQATSGQTPLEGAPTNPGQLIAQWTAADATCRSPTASAIDTVGACEQRDTYSKLLALANYCHDPADKTGPPRWSPCGGNPDAGRPSARALRDAALARSTARFQRMGGVFALSALLNGGTQAYFIVDSGAATVQIPEETAEELRRNGTLTEADFMGQHRFILADGRTMQQRVFRLRSLKIGERTMENVQATVGAPRSRALLGQSFLKRLSWWKVDNVRNAMEFEFTGAF
jgi:clan AA aspartic protease (TIGR02281 family)